MRLLALCSLLIILTIFKVEAIAPGDPSNALHFKNFHGARYGEIIVVTRSWCSLTAHIYSTIGLNDCPESLWNALNRQEIKKENQALSVQLNGPCYSLIDSSTVVTSNEINSFGDLQARLLGDLSIPLSSLTQSGKNQDGLNPYQEYGVNLTITNLFKKENIIHELISPNDVHYVMQSYSQAVEPQLTEADLSTLESHLTLPDGWRYESYHLDEDFVISSSDMAYILEDSLQNTYLRVQ